MPGKVVGRLVQYVVAVEPQAAWQPAARQGAAVLGLVSEDALPVAELEKSVPGARAAVKRLQELGLVTLEKREPPLDPLLAGRRATPDHAAGAQRGAGQGGGCASSASWRQASARSSCSTA